MNKNRFSAPNGMLVTLLFIMAALLLRAAPVCAFKVNKTSTGATIKWHKKQVRYLFSPSEGPGFARSAVESSLDTWSRVAPQNFRFVFAGNTSDNSYAKLDDKNILSFGYLPEGNLGQHNLWYQVSDGKIMDVDIRLSASTAWANGGAGSAYDLQSTATHELGHSVGLDDLYGGGDKNNTMYGYQARGETKKRNLNADDENGLKHLYTNEKVPKNVSGQSTDDAVFADSGGGGGCFIATAAHESYGHPHVMVLRQFRDTVLQKNDTGRLLVKFYYRVSPPIARVISRHGILKKAVQWSLVPVVYGLMYPAAGAAVIFFAITGALVCGLFLFRPKQPREPAVPPSRPS